MFLMNFTAKAQDNCCTIKPLKLRNKNADYVWLGAEENQRAISFYKKNGFVEFDKHIFKLGNDEQIDIMMKLNLKN